MILNRVNLEGLEPRVVPPHKTFADITGFKHEFIRELHKGRPGHEVHLICWLVGRPRHHGAILFCPVGDSTGTIQVVAHKAMASSWAELKTVGLESSLNVSGILAFTRGRAEIILKKASIISKSTGFVHPEIRKLDKDILAKHNTDKVLAYRHLYLRNPLFLTLNLYRSKFFSAIHRWFQDHQFVDISAPLITPSILYEPSSAVHLANLKSKQTLFLSQCAGFYLEAAAHAHERVYNLGPSFRNESRTNRHLMEYWHIKAELCSGQMNDIIDLVEIFLHDISEAISSYTDELTTMMKTSRPRIQIPFQRITYIEALALLNESNFALSFGQNISKPAENLLTEHFGGPVWVTHKPRELEPFPYCICPGDDRLTMTADLISSGGFGEICGVAEKSYTRDELETRMKEKGKMEQMDIYSWVLESRDFGMVPHTAFGMGFERLMRWFCGLPHVKDAIPFPRVFGRDPIP